MDKVTISETTENMNLKQHIRGISVMCIVPEFLVFSRGSDRECCFLEAGFFTSTDDRDAVDCENGEVDAVECRGTIGGSPA